MHATMVEATLRVVANALFSQDFGPMVHSMKDLTTRGLRRTERLGRIGLLGSPAATGLQRADLEHVLGSAATTTAPGRRRRSR